MEKSNNIHEIELYNIQKHKHVKLSLAGINILVGETESGKTSIFRGLLWNMKNNTSGSSIVTNDGSTSCSCTVRVGEHEIQRKWSTSENSYTIDGKVLTSIRTSVPSEVKSVYNIDDVNIQCRRDQPFMLYYKDTECASQFSQMLNIEEIDKVTSAINARVKEYINKCERVNDDINKLEIELASVDFIDLAENQIEEIIKLNKEIDSIHSKYSDLNILCDAINLETYTFKCTYTNLEKCIDLVTYIESVYEDTINTRNRITQYDTLNDEYTKLYNYLADKLLHLDSAQNMLESIEDTYLCVTKYRDKLKEHIPLYDGIKECKRSVVKSEELINDKLYHKIVCKVSEKTELNRRYKELSSLTADIELAESLLNRAIEQYNTEHEKFTKAFPDVCPLCGTPVRGDHAHTSIG